MIPERTSALLVCGPSPETGRLPAFIAVGHTVADMITKLLGNQWVDPTTLRVTLSTRHKCAVIRQEHWAHVRPKAGAQLIVRVVPQEDAARAIVGIVITVAAPFIAGALFPAASAFGLGLATAGVAIGGQLLVNTLFPVSQPTAARTAELQAARSIYQLDGWRNEAKPGAPVPFVCGRHRYAPPFAAQTYMEIVGDQQYVRSLFVFGYGPLRLSGFRIGETPVDDYEDFEIEVREGRHDDEPVSLYPHQVIQQAENIELVRPYPRTASGSVVSGSTPVLTPVTRFTAGDAETASVILGFPQGVYAVNDKGELRSRTVVIQIRQRLDGLGDWSEVETLEITARKREAFFRQHSWTLPSRGRWQLEITRITYEKLQPEISDRSVLAAIQSTRPEYPINVDKPLALVAVRGRATYQLSGTLDSFNALAEAEGLTRSNDAWVTGYSRTPASTFLLALMGPHNPFPVTEAEIDMDAVAEWHDWCVSKGLKYDYVHDVQTPFYQMLIAICSAGRASPRHDGERWSVVIERPQALIVDELSYRNSDQFTWERKYIKKPDAFRVAFIDETNDFRPAERIVPWPGHTGPIDVTEALELPGKVDPDEVWIEARRHQHAIDLRPDSYSAFQSGATRVATRGDKVMAAFDVLESTVFAGRVQRVVDNAVILDDQVSIGDGFSIRFRTYDESDTIGVSHLRPLVAGTGLSNVVYLQDATIMPAPGQMVHIGPTGRESVALRIYGIEAAQDGDNRLLMFADAPEIDSLTDDEIPPVWDGRIGSNVVLAATTPAAPVIDAVSSGVSGTGDADLVEVLLRPGSGNSAVVTSFEIDYRLQGATSFTTISVPAAAGSVLIDAYEKGDVVELQARALAGTTAGPATELVSETIGSGDAAVPVAIPAQFVTGTSGLGHTTIGVTLPASSVATTSVQLYRTATGNTLDTSQDGLGEPVRLAAGATATIIDGDPSATNLLEGVQAALGAGWSISGSAYSRSPAAASSLSFSLALTSGATYRLAASASVSAGSITPVLSAATPATGAVVSASGNIRQAFTAPDGATVFEVSADASFDGSVSDLELYQVTDQAAPVGTFDYYVAPINADGVAGPVTGPLTLEVR